MSHETKNALSVALYRLLRPLVRLLMRHGITYRHFADVARHAYVDVARADFGLPGRKPSNSRVAVLTGINRKDIAKLDERPHPLQSEPEDAHRKNPVARVIEGWMADRRFRDASGNPRELALEHVEAENGEAIDVAEFPELVREFSSDVPFRALLDEMLRVEAAKISDNKVQLISNGYIPFADVEEGLRIAGTASADLLNTLDYNLSNRRQRPFIQRTVSYNNIPVALLEEIRTRSNAEGGAFLLKINDWLAQYDQTKPVKEPGSSHARAGIGIYYFEYPDFEQENPSQDQP